MVMATTDLVATDEFLTLVLADPELLDMAFEAVVASWEAAPPWPPDHTLVATAQWRSPASRARMVDRRCTSLHPWLRIIPRPKVARSPPVD